MPALSRKALYLLHVECVLPDIEDLLQPPRYIQPLLLPHHHASRSMNKRAPSAPSIPSHARGIPQHVARKTSNRAPPFLRSPPRPPTQIKSPLFSSTFLFFSFLILWGKRQLHVVAPKSRTRPTAFLQDLLLLVCNDSIQRRKRKIQQQGQRQPVKSSHKNLCRALPSRPKFDLLFPVPPKRIITSGRYRQHFPKPLSTTQTRTQGHLLRTLQAVHASKDADGRTLLHMKTTHLKQQKYGGF